MITKYNLQTWLNAALRATPQSNTLASLARTTTTRLIEGESERLAWLGRVGAMRRHEGEVRPNRPMEMTYSITNDKFSNGVAIPGAWLRSDKTDSARGKITELGARRIQWPGKLVAQLIEGGYSNLCYTGKAFFATDHVVGKSGTFSNRISFDAAAAAAPTPDEGAKAIAKAIGALWGMLDDQGEPINETMSSVAVVCHTDWADALLAAVNAPNLDTGTGVRQNTLGNAGVRISVIASPRFASLKANNRLVVVRNDSEAAPFVVQENPAESRTEVLAEGSDHYAKQDEALAEIFAVGNAGYGNPQDAVSVELT